MGKLHIEFNIKEPETGRFVTFADDISVENVKDWFIRMALGVEHLFNMEGGARTATIKDISNGYGGKIGAIKLVRELTGCGLREAKDLIENSLSSNTPTMVCNDGMTADRVVEGFRHMNVVVEVNHTGVDIENLMMAQIPRVRTP